MEETSGRDTEEDPSSRMDRRAIGVVRTEKNSMKLQYKHLMQEVKVLKLPPGADILQP